MSPTSIAVHVAARPQFRDCQQSSLDCEPGETTFQQILSMSRMKFLDPFLFFLKHPSQVSKPLEGNVKLTNEDTLFASLILEGDKSGVHLHRIKERSIDEAFDLQSYLEDFHALEGIKLQHCASVGSIRMQGPDGTTMKLDSNDLSGCDLNLATVEDFMDALRSKFNLHPQSDFQITVNGKTPLCSSHTIRQCAVTGHVVEIETTPDLAQLCKEQNVNKKKLHIVVKTMTGLTVSDHCP
jgi:hypothetical protein